MEKLVVELLNPKAKQLLLDLESLNLITIKEPNDKVMELLTELRKNSDSAPTIEEITDEVEIVRAEMHAKRMAQASIISVS